MGNISGAPFARRKMERSRTKRSRSYAEEITNEMHVDFAAPKKKRPRSFCSLPSESPSLFAKMSRSTSLSEASSSSSNGDYALGHRKGIALLSTLYEESPTSPPTSISLDAVNHVEDAKDIIKRDAMVNTQSLHDMRPFEAQLQNNDSFNKFTKEKTEALITPRQASKSISRTRKTAKFVSKSVGKLHFSGAASAVELYRKASRSITSLARPRSSTKRSSVTVEHKELTSALGEPKRGSVASLSKCNWPVPWLEAIFLPEFPIKSTITEKDFSILNRIGCGSFGHVFRVCLKREPGLLFAMKTQQKSEILAKEATRQIKNEASIHKHLSSSVFIAKFYASWQSRVQLYTVLQYAMGYGDLFTLWRDYGPFAEETLRIYAAEIALAIDYMHRNEIVYRDLKMENVVLDLDGHIQLIDFGFAKRLPEGDRTNTICGTLQYMAPEIARGLPYGKYVDWWSFGVLLHVLLTNRYPFPNKEATSHEQLRYSDYCTPLCETSLGDLFNKLLCVNLERRLHSFIELKSHRFFKTVIWEDVALKKVEPYAHIERLRRCPSCNSMYDRSGSEISSTDVEENWAAFDENYGFNDEDYFQDRL